MSDHEIHHHHHHYYEGAGRADRPSPNPHRFRRSSRHRVIGGVFGGIAEYFGWRVHIVRIVGVIATVAFMPFVPIAYVLAMLFIPSDRAEPKPRESKEDQDFWRGVSTQPKATFGKLKHRFRAIEGRLADMERTVTSEEYRLKEAFRDLERDPRSS